MYFDFLLNGVWKKIIRILCTWLAIPMPGMYAVRTAGEEECAVLIA